MIRDFGSSIEGEGCLVFLSCNWLLIFLSDTLSVCEGFSELGWCIHCCIFELVTMFGCLTLDYVLSILLLRDMDYDFGLLVILFLIYFKSSLCVREFIVLQPTVHLFCLSCCFALSYFEVVISIWNLVYSVNEIPCAAICYHDIIFVSSYFYVGNRVITYKFWRCA